jgi:RNA polymerase sigma-70 factor (ECF subfamily)
MQSEEHKVAEELAKMVADGDREAESRIYRRYERGLLYLLRKRVGDASVAEDLCQEAFIILLRRLRTEGLTDPGRMNGYLYGIAHKLAAREIGNRAKRDLAVESAFLESRPDPAPDQFDQVARAQLHKIVHELFAELRVERDRQILRRFWIYDEDKETICSVLDIDSVHFNRVIHRAKSRFRELVFKADQRRHLHVIDGSRRHNRKKR